MPEYFCTNFVTNAFVTNALLCAVFTWHMSNWQKRKLQERISQLKNMLILLLFYYWSNWATSTTFVWRHYFYVYVQHSIVINSSIFQVIIAVRPITLVIGKISYEDKARVETLRKLGFGYRTTVAKFLEKGWKLCSVKAICKRVDEHGSATERKPGSGRPKTAQTEENVRYLKLFISENRTLSLMLRHSTKY